MSFHFFASTHIVPKHMLDATESCGTGTRGKYCCGRTMRFLEIAIHCRKFPAHVSVRSPKNSNTARERRAWSRQRQHVMQDLNAYGVQLCVSPGRCHSAEAGGVSTLHPGRCSHVCAIVAYFVLVYSGQDGGRFGERATELDCVLRLKPRSTDSLIINTPPITPYLQV